MQQFKSSQPNQPTPNPDHDRTGRPVVNHDESGHEQTMLNEVNTDVRIPGWPHSVVKHAQSTSFREMIQKIENHPHRHALQRDLQQSQSFNPFSPESKQMIHEVGNIELCEFLDTEPKAQCKACLSNWDVGIVYCTCGHFLRNGTEENEKVVQDTMDLLSIPTYYLDKGRPHGRQQMDVPQWVGARDSGTKATVREVASCAPPCFCGPLAFRAAVEA